MAGFDLHTHSTRSDGVTTIADNVEAAVRAGLAGLAVTDHDTTAGFDEAYAAVEGRALQLVPGTEFSAELDGISVHVLGYWIAPDDPALSEELRRLRDERADRAERMVELLGDLGIDVSMERVEELAGDAPIGRPHVARAVVEAGAAPDLDAVFTRFLADGGPAYVPKHAVTPVRAVELITGSGGVAVCAHPGLFGRREAGEPGLPAEPIEEMAAAGLAGLEADHPDHTPEQGARYRDLAADLGLVVTGGSDYHGGARDHELGEVTTPREVVAALHERSLGWG